MGEMLPRCIGYFESILHSQRFLLSPSTRVILEHTVRYLKELKEIKQQLESIDQDDLEARQAYREYKELKQLLDFVRKVKSMAEGGKDAKS